MEIERRALAMAYHVKEVGARDLISELGQNHSYDVAVISSHGDGGVGLSHGLFLDDGEILNAAAMLRMKIPDILIMGSCWSGSLYYATDVEPLGLPTVALLRGAHAVIGGVYSLPDGPNQPTAELLGSLHRELATGRSAPEALRVAQLKLLGDHLTRDWRNWAGVTCLMRFVDEKETRVNVARDVDESPAAKPMDSPASRHRGVVKWFNSDKGFGFIAQVGGGLDVFVHFSDIEMDGPWSLAAGQQVEFDIVTANLGPRAVRVRLASR